MSKALMYIGCGYASVETHSVDKEQLDYWQLKEVVVHVPLGTGLTGSPEISCNHCVTCSTADPGFDVCVTERTKHADSAQNRLQVLMMHTLACAQKRLQVSAGAHDKHCRFFSVPVNMTILCEHALGTQGVSPTAKLKLTFKCIAGSELLTC